MSEQRFKSPFSRVGWLLLCLFGAVSAIVGVTTAVAQNDPTPQPPDKHLNVWGDPHVSFVVDTRGSMAAELNALNEAWSPQNVLHPPLTATYHLAAFKEDQALYRGNTQNSAQLNNWLSQLEASGGNGCHTAAFNGMRSSLRNLPVSNTPASDMLLITDGTPQGMRQNYAYMLDRLLRQGVRWHMLSSGWCNEGQPTLEQVQFLAERTGGTAFAPLQPAEYLTETIITLNQLLAQDTILSQQGLLDNETVVIPFNLGDATDFRIETTTGSWTGCLTCTLLANTAVSTVAPTSLEFQLIDPNGDHFYDASSPYLVLHQTSARTQLSYTGCLTCIDFNVDNWQLVVSGSGAYEVNIKANTGIHMANLSQFKAAVDKATPMQVALFQGPHETESADSLARPHPIGPLTATFRLVSLNGQMMRPLALFDDGQHNDGLAGDGLYGGQVNVPEPGYWRVMVTGVLSSGTELEPFMRLDPTPMQFRRPRSSGPGAAPQLVGSTRMVNFSLTNSGGGETRAAQTMSFDIGVYSEQGWVVTDSVPMSVTLAPNETINIPVEVVVPADAPVGTVEETTFVAVPIDDFTDSSTAVVETTAVDQLNIYLPVVTR